MPKTLNELLAELNGSLAQLSAGAAAGAQAALAAPDRSNLPDLFDPARAAGLEQRAESRFAGPGADPAALQRLAATPPGQRSPDGMMAVSPQATFGTGRGLQGLGAVMTKALAEATPSAGGYLVQPEVSSEVMRMLRNRSAILRLGPRIVPVLKELSVPSISTGATAGYYAENATAAVSEPTFASTPLLTPKDLVAMVPISNRLLRDAAESPSVEQVLREDLAEVLALRADLAFLQGTGSGAEPTGIKNTAGKTAGPDLGVDGRALTFDDLKLTVAALRDVNAPFLKPGWAMSPRTLSGIERLKDADGRYLGDNPQMLTYDPVGGGGTLLGFPFIATGQIPNSLTRGSNTDASYLVFSSDWDEAWVGENLSLIIEANGAASYTTDGGTTWKSAYQNREFVFRAVACHDFALRRPKLFTVVEGIRPLA